MEPLGVLCLGSRNPSAYAKTNENSYHKSYVGAGFNASDGQPSAHHKGEN